MKKSKLGFLTGLTAISAVIPTLATVSCGQQVKVNKIGEEYDKEYGVNEASYTKLKISFEDAVVEKLVDPTPDEIAKARASVRKACRAFDEQFNEMPELSYTALTSSVIEYASRVYGVKLVRTTSTKTAKYEELDEAFYGMCDSMEEYMKASDVPAEQRTAILEQAKDLYFNPDDGLRVRTTNEYDDALLGITKARAELLSCFADVNENIGLVAAANRLKDFLSTHTIEYDVNKEDNSNKLDYLEKNAWFREGADLSVDSNILKIYTITRKGEDTPLETFDAEKVCPGYTVKPILKAIKKDAKRNDYSLAIDWTCVKTEYLKSNDAEKAERTTAHYYNPKYSSAARIDVEAPSVYEMLKDISTESSLSYPINLSKEGERQALLNTYFNPDSPDGCISLDWDRVNVDKNAFDVLFKGSDVSKTTTQREYIVDVDSLAKSGLTVTYTPPHNSNDPSETKRLDEYIAINGGQSKSPEENRTAKTLVQEFLDNCTLWGDIKPIDSETKNGDLATYSSNNAVYIDYQNTLYPQGLKGDKNESYCPIESQNFDNLFTISTQSYDSLTSSFNEQMDFVEDYIDNMYDDEYDAAVKDVAIQTVFLILTTLFTAQTTVFCFVPVFAAHLLIYIALLALTWASFAGQATILGLLVECKLKPIKEMKEKCDDIKNSAQIQTIYKIIKDSKDNNYLCRYDKETHSIGYRDYRDGFDKFQSEKTNFFTQVLPTLDWYQTLNQDETYQQFIGAIQKAQVDPQTYQDKMSVWDKDGDCQKASIGLIISTLALDITSIVLVCKCPELKDWELVKLAKADADATGKSFKSMVETYRNLKKVKDSLDLLKKSLGEVGGKLGWVWKVSAKEAVDFCKLNGIEEIAKTVPQWIESKMPQLAEATLELSSEVSTRAVSQRLLELVSSGEGGFAATARILSGFAAKGASMGKVGETTLGAIIRDLSTALFGDINKFRNELSNIGETLQNIFRGLAAESDRIAIKLAMEAAEISFRMGKFEDVFECLKQVDTILLDTARWSKSFNIPSDMLLFASRFAELPVGFICQDLLTAIGKAGNFIIRSI